MDRIVFTEESGILLETANDFCRDHSPMASVRARLDAKSTDMATWKKMTDLGWLAINVPADHGGLDMGLAGVVPVVEAMGRRLMASPYPGTVLASEAVVTSGSVAQKAHWLPKIAAGAPAAVALTEEGGSWVLDDIGARARAGGNGYLLAGSKHFVTDADLAEVILVSAGLNGLPRLFLVHREDLPDGALVRQSVIDETRRSFTLNLDGVSVPDSRLMPSADFRSVELAAMLLVTAEIAGGLVGVLHAMVDYLKTRKAFDRFIGSYQALKHPAVDILLSLEGCRSQLYHAATLYASGNGREAEVAIRMAKAQGSEAFAYAGDRAVQFHGGFGFTYDCDAHLYLRRALWCQYQFGDEKYQRRLLAPLLLGEATQPLAHATPGVTQPLT